MADQREVIGAKARLKRPREAESARSASQQEDARQRDDAANTRRRDAPDPRHEAPRSVNFMYQPPPVPERRNRPEDAIPDEPQNQQAREFLRRAPTEGLWMPLGKEVKLMQCWRCKAYGHRAGDKECTLFQVGSDKTREFAQIYEDPMAAYVKHDAAEEKRRTREEKLARVEYLQKLLAEEEEKQKRRKAKKKHKKRKRASSSDSDSPDPKRKKHKDK